MIQTKNKFQADNLRNKERYYHSGFSKQHDQMEEE
jgi:hypothetical protein